MCGICGVLYTDTAHQVEREVVRRMTDAILHRGPDDDGYFFDGPVGLGMRRLSIIDLEGGKQPITNEDGTISLVCNGEIYNYRQLRGALLACGHRFCTRSDVEVIVHAYEEDAIGCLGRLRGMFAVGLWDRAQRRLLLAVDRFGIKPLYWTVDASGIAFGSELKCIPRSGIASLQLDPIGLSQYFTFGYIPPPRTVFAGVQKLAPGTLLEWSPAHGAMVHQYWETPRGAVDQTAGTAKTRAQLRDALRDSVRSHLVSDVPLGAFLSGGIDSSALVGLLSEVSSDPVRTFSIGFADPRHNELDKARIVARRYGTEHHELIVEPESVELLPTLVAHFGEPFADSSALPTYHVSRLAGEHVKVVLSGDGGDELFLGYTLFRGLELARAAQALPAPARKALAALASVVPIASRAHVSDHLALLRKRMADTMLPPELAFKRKISAPGIGAALPFLSPTLHEALAQHDPFDIVDGWLARYHTVNGAHPLERFVYTGFQTSLAGDMLVKVDRMSMANSLEVRVPFLDHLLAEHVAAIPIGSRMPRWRLKGLLKDTLADVLPAEVLRSPKHGFSVPVSAWFRGSLQRYARDVLLSPDAVRRGLLDTKAIEQLLLRHGDGGGEVGTLIWTLLMFELWCQETLG
jgi:asparagine synthase (glutamine-hydrolysing)